MRGKENTLAKNSREGLHLVSERRHEWQRRQSEDDQRHSGKRMLQYHNSHGIIFSTKNRVSIMETT